MHQNVFVGWATDGKITSVLRPRSWISGVRDESYDGKGIEEIEAEWEVGGKGRDKEREKKKNTP